MKRFQKDRTLGKWFTRSLGKGCKVWIEVASSLKITKAMGLNLRQKEVKET